MSQGGWGVTMWLVTIFSLLSSLARSLCSTRWQWWALCGVTDQNSLLLCCQQKTEPFTSPNLPLLPLPQLYPTFQRKTGTLSWWAPLTKLLRVDRRPVIILENNKFKGGVDNLGKVTDTYSCERKTACWPLVLLFNMVDISAYNSCDLVWGQPNLEGMCTKLEKVLLRGAG